MSTQTDVDIEAMVGELPDVQCESFTHGIHHPEGPATYYARVLCPQCGDNHIKAYCDPFISKVRANDRMNCPECFGIHYALEVVTILGPVNK